MTRSAPPARRSRRRALRRLRARGEDGFILLESIVSISLITVILAALGTFTVRSIAATTDLRARQAATQVATSAMSLVNSVPPSDLVSGRDRASADSQYDRGHLIPLVAASLDTLAKKSVTAPDGSGATATVSTSPQTVTLDSIPFTVDTYVGTCVIPNGTTACAPTGTTGVTYLRAVIWVSWTGRGCSTPAPASCLFTTSTLINTDAEPVFNVNAAIPSPAPVVVDPGTQKSTIGGPVSLQLAVKNGTGLTPFTWAVTQNSLPVGLSLDTTGLITGTPTVLQSALPLEVTATDAFGRTGSVTFSWTVLAAPTIVKPAPQSSKVNKALSLATSSTCPNSACTFALSNAPSGLGIDPATGVISGTPTAVGLSSNVTVTITDAASVSTTTAPFTWTITASPTVTSPGNQGLTVGQPVSIPVPYTCPNPSCTITLTNGVPGLVLSTTAANAAPSTPETASKFTVPGAVDTTGTTNLSQGRTATQSSLAFGGSPGRAVDGNTDGVFNNGSITHSDYQNQPWWQVDLGSASLVRAVKIWNRTDCCDTRLSNFYVFTSPTDMTGKTATQLLADPTVAVQRISGLNGTPSITIPDQSAGRYVRVQLANLGGGSEYLSLAEVQVLGAVDTGSSVTVSAPSGVVYVTGVVPASAVPSGTSKAYTPNVSIVDVNANTDQKSAGTWTVFTPPTISALGTKTVFAQAVSSTAVPYTCPVASCTVSLSGTVPGLGLSSTGTETAPNNSTTLTLSSASGTIYLSGKVTSSALVNGAATAYAPAITITDVNMAAASTTGNFTVSPLSVLVPDQATSRPLLFSKTVTVDASKYVTPTGTYTYALTNAPSWLSINRNTGLMTATINALSPSATNITLTVTDGSGATATDLFNWTLN